MPFKRFFPLSSLWSGLFFLLGCSGASESEQGEDRGFRVSDPDHLYFKNTQIRDYRATEDTERYRTIYLHDLMANDTSGLDLLLVDNWIRSQAFLEFAQEPASKAEEKSTLRFYENEAGGPKQIFSSQQLEDAIALRAFYDALGRNTEICVEGFQPLPYCLPGGGKLRKGMRATIADFVKLTQLNDRNR